MNNGCGADSGRSRGDSSRRAVRPITTSADAVCNDRLKVKTSQADSILTLNIL
jgi:hypothetical protein